MIEPLFNCSLIQAQAVDYLFGEGNLLMSPTKLDLFLSDEETAVTASQGTLAALKRYEG